MFLKAATRQARNASRSILLLPVRSVKTSTLDWKPIKSSVTNLSKAENQAKSSGFRKSILGLMIAMPVISFCLGCWQVKRLDWKVNLIAKCEDSLAKPPLESLPAQLDPEVIPEFEYRRFKIKGRFNYDQEMFLGPRMKNGELGYLLITPFVRSSGGKPILIERGWIAKNKVVPNTRSSGYLSHLALPQGEVEIEAMFRIMPKRSRLQYEHEKGTRVFNIPDVETMAAESGSLPIYAQMVYSLHDKPEWIGPDEKQQQDSQSWYKKLFNGSSSTVHPDRLPESSDDYSLQFQEFEFAKQGVPIGTVPKVNFTNNHLQYLVTWFGVSIASSFLLGWSFYKKKMTGSAEKVLEAKRRNMKRNF